MSYNLLYDKNQSYYIYKDTLIHLYIVYLEMIFLPKKGMITFGLKRKEFTNKKTSELLI